MTFLKNLCIYLTGRMTERESTQHLPSAVHLLNVHNSWDSVKTGAQTFIEASMWVVRTKGLGSSLTTFPGILIGIWSGGSTTQTSTPTLDTSIPNNSLTCCTTITLETYFQINLIMILFNSMIPKTVHLNGKPWKLI